MVVLLGGERCQSRAGSGSVLFGPVRFVGILGQFEHAREWSQLETQMIQAFVGLCSIIADVLLVVVLVLVFVALRVACFLRAES